MLLSAYNSNNSFKITLFSPFFLWFIFSLWYYESIRWFWTNNAFKIFKIIKLEKKILCTAENFKIFLQNFNWIIFFYNYYPYFDWIQFLSSVFWSFMADIWHMYWSLLDIRRTIFSLNACRVHEELNIIPFLASFISNQRFTFEKNHFWVFPLHCFVLHGLLYFQLILVITVLALGFPPFPLIYFYITIIWICPMVLN